MTMIHINNGGSSSYSFDTSFVKFGWKKYSIIYVDHGHHQLVSFLLSFSNIFLNFCFFSKVIINLDRSCTNVHNMPVDIKCYAHYHLRLAYVYYEYECWDYFLLQISDKCLHFVTPIYGVNAPILACTIANHEWEWISNADGNKNELVNRMIILKLRLKLKLCRTLHIINSEWMDG